MKRFLSSPFFLIALLCFFLPFFAVKCSQEIPQIPGIPGGGQQTSKEVTGVQLLTGQAEEELASPGGDAGEAPGGFPFPGPSPSVPIGGDPTEAATVDLGGAQLMAIIAAALALLGIFLALLAGRVGGILALVLGAAGAGVLFLLQSEFKGSVLDSIGGEQAETFIKIENLIGFWAALGSFIVAALTGLVRILLPDRPTLAPPASAAPGYGPPPAGGAPGYGPPPARPPDDVPPTPPPSGPPTAPQ